MITADLQQQVIQQLSQRTACNDWTVSDTVIEARECVVYKLVSPSYPHAIALKIYRPGFRDRLLTQYQALKRYSTLMTDLSEQFKVPWCYGCFAEHNAFIMEWIDSAPLTKRLWRYFYSRKQQQADIKRTFIWLKNYHACAERELKELDIDRYKKRLHLRLSQLDSQSLEINDQRFHQGLRCIEELTDFFRDSATYHARIHGDFNTNNILVEDRVINGIDILSKRVLPVEDDITLQLTYISTNYINMLTRGDMRKPFTDWPVLELALHAYGYPNDKKSQAFFLFVFLFQLLNRWVLIELANKDRYKSLASRWYLRNTRLIVAGVTRALEKLVAEPDGVVI